MKKNGIPKGIRTPVVGMKTRCPRPLDDGDAYKKNMILKKLASPRGFEPLLSG
mgnify:CR=1 FL=1